MCDMPHSYVWHASFICVTWLIYVCDMPHSYVWHAPFICVMLLTHMRDGTQSHVWHDSFMCETWLWLQFANDWSVMNLKQRLNVSLISLCVAVCCSVLQCVAVCCSVLQCVAVCCNELGHRLNVSLIVALSLPVAVCHSALQCVPVCCSVLQFVAVYVAMYCGVLPHLSLTHTHKYRHG